MLFIPSPNVAEDHQAKNALAISKKKAALLIKESDLEVKFETELSNLISSEEKQFELSRNIKNLGKPNAAKEIVTEIERIIKSRSQV